MREEGGAPGPELGRKVRGAEESTVPIKVAPEDRPGPWGHGQATSRTPEGVFTRALFKNNKKLASRVYFLFLLFTYRASYNLWS